MKAADNVAVGKAPAKVAAAVSVLEAPKASDAVVAQGYIPASAYAKKLSRENGVSLNTVLPTGVMGEVKARDVEARLKESEKETRVNASPLAQRIAADKQIDISTLAGSGYNGKVLKEDIQGSVSAQKAPAKEAAFEEGFRREKISGMRKVIADRMLKAHTEIPSVTLNMAADVTDLLTLREQINAKREKADKISINDFVIKAVAKALETNRNILVSLEGDFIVYKENTFNIGMAVATDTGLIVPVIKEADKMGLETISKSAKDLAKRAREGKARDGRI